MFFAKIVKNYNYFPKALHLRSSIGFWIGLSLNKYSLNSRVTSRYVLYDTFLLYDTFYYCKFKHSQTYSHPIQTYSATLPYLEPYITIPHSKPCHIQNTDILSTQEIFRTLSRHILAYSERCVTLAYWELFHIQN